MSWHFDMTCVGADGDSIRQMQDVAQDISYTTIRRALGDALIDLESNFGYATRRSRGLHMKDDFAVSYARSLYEGRPCYYVVHSRIEHMFFNDRLTAVEKRLFDPILRKLNLRNKS